VSFVNQVSHELKTPLTNIRMYAELLSRDLTLDDDSGENERQRRRLDIIVAESQRLSRLIGNVLTFARKERRALALRPSAHVFDAVVDEVVLQFVPAFAAKNIEVERTHGALQRAQLDRDVCEQIVANLLSNVEKYAPQGRVRITTAQYGATLELIVHDSGPGIPQAQAKAAFAPFVRLDNSITSGATGAGIGLALARDLARMHHGDLALVPSAAGAKFRLTLRAEPVLEA
jgi:signal transduction histidine kinase